MKITQEVRLVGHLRLGGGGMLLAERAKSGKIFIDCQTCNMSFVIRDENIDRISDAQFIELVRAHGWKCNDKGKEAICPKCQKKKRGGVCHE
jgi:hypothetical protein